MSEGLENTKEVRVNGIRRSGNHAIIGWIKRNHSPPVVHLNDVDSENHDIQERVDPYETFGSINIKEIPFWRCKPKPLSVIKHAIAGKEEGILIQQDPWVQVDYIASQTKDLLVISYENHFLNDSLFDEFDRRHDALVGTSGRRYDVVLLRDAYNLFASLIKSGLATAQNADRFIRLYKHYAREVLGETDYTDREATTRVVIKFNDWFADPGYRRSVAEQLGFTTDGQGYEEVPHEGGGSSFSGQKKAGEARRLGVLQRWKHFTDHPLYTEIMDDDELKELTEQIFPHTKSVLQ